VKLVQEAIPTKNILERVSTDERFGLKEGREVEIGRKSEARRLGEERREAPDLVDVGLRRGGH
jgi:hypothetical protein